MNVEPSGPQKITLAANLDLVENNVIGATIGDAAIWIDTQRRRRCAGYFGTPLCLATNSNSWSKMSFLASSLTWPIPQYYALRYNIQRIDRVARVIYEPEAVIDRDTRLHFKAHSGLDRRRVKWVGELDQHLAGRIDFLLTENGGQRIGQRHVDQLKSQNST